MCFLIPFVAWLLVKQYNLVISGEAVEWHLIYSAFADLWVKLQTKTWLHSKSLVAVLYLNMSLTCGIVQS